MEAYTYQQLLDHWKTQTAIAAALEVTQAAVSLWSVRGIPKLRQYQIAAVIAAEPKPIAPETPIAAPQSVPTAAESRRVIPWDWDRSSAGIGRAGTILGIKASPGETWNAYADRLRQFIAKR